MKLVNAKLYEEQIKRKMWEIWYDEKYQYYFGGNYRCDFSLNDDPGDYPKRAFAVLNDRDELLGCIRYSVDSDMRVAMCWGWDLSEKPSFTEEEVEDARAIMRLFGLDIMLAENFRNRCDNLSRKRTKGKEGVKICLSF